MALASLLILHEERLKSQSGALHAGGWAESSAQGFPNPGLCRSFPLSWPVFGDVGLAFAYCEGAGDPVFSVRMHPVPFSLGL